MSGYKLLGVKISIFSFRICSSPFYDASARLLIDEIPKPIQLGALPTSSTNWLRKTLEFSVSKIWDTQAVIEVTVPGPTTQILASCKSKTLKLWDLIQLPEYDRKIELYTSDNRVLGLAYIRIGLDMSKLSKPVFHDRHPRWKIPTFRTLFRAIEALETCQTVDRFSRDKPYRLANIFLCLTWSYLEQHWPELEKQARQAGIPSTDLRGNAAEDSLTLIRYNATFLAVVIEVMENPIYKKLKTPAMGLIYAIAKTAALVHQCASLYTLATYGTVGLDTINASTLFQSFQREQAHQRAQVLACYYDEYTLFRKPEYLVQDLFKHCIREYKEDKDKTWKWSSYTSALACLRHQDAHKAFAIMRAVFENDNTSSRTRDFLRRLMAHVMLDARQPPNFLILDSDGIFMDRSSNKGMGRKESPPAHVGHGSYGVVYRGKYQDPKTLYGEDIAVKCLHLRDDISERSLYPEIINCFTLIHPHVLRLRGITRDNGTISLVFPWMHNGRIVDCLRRLKSEKQHNLEVLSHRWICQIASALAYIHAEGIAHGDLRAANILVDRNRNAKISDFGLSVYANGQSRNYDSTRQGNEGWLAPELQADATGRPRRPTREGDIFSFAITCIEVYSGMDAWENTPLRTPSRHAAIMRGVRPNRPINPSTNKPMESKLWDLIQQCWHQDPSRRPSAQRIFEKLQA